MEKRTPHEKEKYQPSYETTILTEVGAHAGGGRKRGEPGAGAEELAARPGPLGPVVDRCETKARRILWAEEGVVTRAGKDAVGLSPL